MSTADIRERIESHLQFIAKNKDSALCENMRAGIYLMLAATKPDHKLGKILLHTPDIEVLRKAAELHGTSLFRGAAGHPIGRTGGGSFIELPFREMEPEDRLEAIRILFGVFKNTSHKAVPTLVHHAFGFEDLDILKLMHEVHPQATRRVILRHRGHAKLQGKYKLVRLIAKILEECEADDLTIEERTELMTHAIMDKEPLTVVILAKSGPFKPIDLAHLPRKTDFGVTPEVMNVVERLSTAHGRMELRGNKQSYEHIFSPQARAERNR